MEIIDRFSVPRRRGAETPATIELLRGDLSAIPPDHAVDALVVSAFQELPPIIGIYSFVDCVEGDLVKLRACASTVVS